MDRVNGADFVDIGGGRRGFRSQNRASGLAGTEVTAVWLNMVQEELLTVVEAAGLAASESDWTQLWQALRIGLLGHADIPVNGWQTTPPGSPAVLDCYVVRSAGTGAWAGQSDKIALWIGTNWVFRAPVAGMLASYKDAVGGLSIIWFNGTSWKTAPGAAEYVSDTGIANAVVIAPDSPITAHVAGRRYMVRVNAANTGATTIAVSGLTPRSLVRMDGGALQANDIRGGEIIHVVCDPDLTRYRIVGMRGATDTIAGVAKAASQADVDARVGTGYVPSGYLRTASEDYFGLSKPASQADVDGRTGENYVRSGSIRSADQTNFGVTKFANSTQALAGVLTN